MKRRSHEPIASPEAAFVLGARRAWSELAIDLAREGRSPESAAAEARRAVQMAALAALAGPDLLPEALVHVCPPDGEPLDDQSLWAALAEPLRSRTQASLATDEPGAISPEIFGRIHEELLGQRLTASADGGWAVVSSRAARRASGVFYTPRAIAEYIVGRAIRGAGVGRVLDPACGGGAFLLAAWRRLRELGQPTDGLLGVDLDPEAVLLARRAVWLEACRSGVALADVELEANILCADALSGPPLDQQRGALDAVVGNPPYRRELGARELMARLAQSELGRRHRAPRMDLWYYFLHRGLELLHAGARLSFVVGAYWTASKGAAKLIAEIRDSARVEEIVCLDARDVFGGVAGRHMILSLQKGGAAGPTIIRRAAARSQPVEELLAGRGEAFEKAPEQLFQGGRMDLEPACQELARIDGWPPLGSLGLVRQGIAENPASVDGQGVFVLRPEEAELLELAPAERALLRPYHVLADLGPHWMRQPPSRLLVYSTAETWPEADRFPRLRAHLERFRAVLEARRETRLGRRAWWHLHWPRPESIWRSPKVISVQMGRRPAFVASSEVAYVPFSANVFVPSAEVREHLFYFAGVLGSRLLWQWYKHHAKRRGVGLEINGHVLARTPVRRIDFSSAADRARHDRLVSLVERRMARPACHAAPLEAEMDWIVEELYDSR